MISHFPKRGVFYVILLKILLATVLIDHTGEVGINSSYYPIYYLPVVTAALYCGPLLTLVWTLIASAAYCSYLYPAMQEYELTAEAFPYLALRIMFFFLAAMVVNRFAQQSKHQTQLYRELAERLAETNRRLEQAQAEARRSERLAALGQLSAGLAHEIRNPLGVIKGSAEMLTQKLQASDELSRELAGYISTEVNRLSALVTEFLDFARPLHAQPYPADLIALLDRVLQVVAARFAGKPASPIPALMRDANPCASNATMPADCPWFRSMKVCVSKLFSTWCRMPMKPCRIRTAPARCGSRFNQLLKTSARELNFALPTPAPEFPKNCAKKSLTPL